MIFVDMDGVLCDFIGSAFRVHGKTFDPANYPKGLWDCEKHLGVSSEKFWHLIHDEGESFWYNLEPYPWAEALIRQLQELDDITIATSPSRDASSYAGKRRWLQRHRLCHLNAMFGSQKYLMARPGRILVDDSEHNLSMWRSEKGIGVRVPQPWNLGEDVDDVVAHVVEEIERSRRAKIA